MDRAIGVIFRFLCRGEIAPGFDRVVGRKFLALAWVIDPSLFEDSPSLAKMARKLKVAPKTLQNRSA